MKLTLFRSNTCCSTFHHVCICSLKFFPSSAHRQVSLAALNKPRAILLGQASCVNCHFLLANSSFPRWEHFPCAGSVFHPREKPSNMNIIMQFWSPVLFMEQDNVLMRYFKLSVGLATWQTDYLVWTHWGNREQMLLISVLMWSSRWPTLWSHKIVRLEAKWKSKLKFKNYSVLCDLYK